MLTKNQVAAAGRHAVTAASTVVAVLGALSLISASDAAAIKESIEQISGAVIALSTAVTAILAILMPIYAGKAAAPAEQVKRALDTDPGLVIQTAVDKAPTQAAEHVAAAAPLESMKAVGELPQVDRVVAASASIAASVPSSTVVAPDPARDTGSQR